MLHKNASIYMYIYVLCACNYVQGNTHTHVHTLIHCRSAMKSGRLYSMATSGQEIAIDLDPPSTPRGRGRGVLPPPVTAPHRGHSRSASWSFTRGQGPLRTDLSNLPSINPMTPITTVIREIVPSFGQLSRLSRNSSTVGTPRFSRDSSLTSVARGEDDGLLDEQASGEAEATVDPSLNLNLHLQGTVNNGTEEQNIGLEISDGIWWLEHNALFIILLVLRFAWYHRSGTYSIIVLSCVTVFGYIHMHVGWVYVYLHCVLLYGFVEFTIHPT